jgi:hypothetical protein
MRLQLNGIFLADARFFKRCSGIGFPTLDALKTSDYVCWTNKKGGFGKGAAFFCMELTAD